MNYICTPIHIYSHLLSLNLDIWLVFPSIFRRIKWKWNEEGRNENISTRNIAKISPPYIKRKSSNIIKNRRVTVLKSEEVFLTLCFWNPADSHHFEGWKYEDTCFWNPVSFQRATAQWRYLYKEWEFFSLLQLSKLLCKKIKEVQSPCMYGLKGLQQSQY